MKNTVLSVSREIEVAGSYDVIVVGGGVAGVGAALAAARNGKKVLILEKSVMLGGLATLGLIAYYLPIDDGKGRRITSGLAEELLHLSIKYSYGTLPPEWKDAPAQTTPDAPRYKTRYSPAEFVMAMEELLIQEGVEFLFDSVFSEPVMEGDTCKAIIVEEKGGRKAYTAKMFVDASGDCDLMRRAGAPIAQGQNWVSFWCYSTSLDMMADAVEKKDLLAGLDLKWWADSPYNMTPDNPFMVLENARDITEFVIRGRQTVLNGIRDRDHSTGAVVTLPGMAQVRTTYRLEGEYTLREEDADRHFEDSIGACCEWRRVGSLYEVPYRTLVTRKLSNVIAAGRCISSRDDAWEITRIIPPCVMTGQAAGTAAAMAIDADKNLHEIDVPALQQKLADAGVLIHF